MEVFVTGATGFVGGAVAARLLAAGHGVRGLARSAQAEARLRDAGVEPVPGGLEDVDVVAAAAARADATVHAAFETSRRGVALDRGVVDAALAALAGTGKAFVYTSGTAVAGDLRGRVGDEAAPLPTEGPVAWRAEVERAVVAGWERGVRTAVVRPSTVYGHGGGGVVLGLVAAARRDGAVRFPGDGSQRWCTVHVDDLADLYLRVAERAPAGSVWIGTSGETLRLRTLAEAASRAGGAEGRVEGLDPVDARAKLGWMADLLALDLAVTGEKAKRELGWDPRGPTLLQELEGGAYAGEGG